MEVLEMLRRLNTIQNEIRLFKDYILENGNLKWQEIARTDKFAAAKRCAKENGINIFEAYKMVEKFLK